MTQGALAGQALRGRRILVTRARAQSRGLQELLEAEGAEVIAVPAIEIAPPDSYAPLDAALRQIAGYDWLVLTSVNAVEAMAARALQIGIPLESLAPVRIAAIGSATAEAISALGLAVALTPPRAVAESLAAALAPRVTGKRVLLIRAKVARDVLPEALASAGAVVTIAEAYQTVIPQSSVEALRAAFRKPVDAVTFTSASSVMNMASLLLAASVVLPDGVQKISIGPITTEALRQKGWTADAEARGATMPELLSAVIEAVETNPKRMGCV